MDGPSTRDLADRSDVDVLLRRFYGRAFADGVLEEPFSESHLPVMCDFWETVLFARGATIATL